MPSGLLKDHLDWGSLAECHVTSVPRRLSINQALSFLSTVDDAIEEHSLSAAHFINPGKAMKHGVHFTSFKGGAGAKPWQLLEECGGNKTCRNALRFKSKEVKDIFCNWIGYSKKKGGNFLLIEDEKDREQLGCKGPKPEVPAAQDHQARHEANATLLKKYIDEMLKCNEKACATCTNGGADASWYKECADSACTCQIKKGNPCMRSMGGQCADKSCKREHKVLPNCVEPPDPRLWYQKLTGTGEKPKSECKVSVTECK